MGPIPKKSLRIVLLPFDIHHVLKFRKDPFRGVDGSDSKKATLAKQIPSPYGIAIQAATNKTLNNFKIISEFYYRASSYASAVLAVVILSFYPSVTRALCDLIKLKAILIGLPHDRAITLVFRQQQLLVGDAPIRLKFVLKLTK